MLSVTTSVTDPLIYDEVGIRIDGARPGADVEISVSTQPYGATATATFAATEDGQVDLARQAPLFGDYSGVEPMGLFWAAQLGTADFACVLECVDSAQMLISTIRARDASGTAELVLQRRAFPPEVTRSPVRTGRLRGTLFSAAGETSRPGIIVLGGSGGGCYELPAALLASHGFTALALPYFAYDDLPAQLMNIPLEYFQDAIDWLGQHPSVAGRAVGVVGQSRGGELALLLGASFNQIAAVAALVPSSLLMGSPPDPSGVIPSSWTLGGRGFEMLAVPFDAEWTTAMAELVTGDHAPTKPLRGTPMTQTAVSAAGADLIERCSITAERTRGPILLVSGTDDEMWPSTTFCELAVERLRKYRFPHRVTHLAYAGAGHTAGLPPYLPTTRNWAVHPQFPIPMSFGGTTVDTAHAQVDVWENVVKFFTDTLPR